MKKATIYLGVALLVGGAVWAQQKQEKPVTSAPPVKDTDWKKLTERQWRERLTATQFAILRKAATEYAFRNAYHDNHKPGIYQCAGCAQELFSSETKFDSGTGWPSFYQPLKKTAVVEKRDPDGERSEVVCSRCLGHLGHVFNDANGEYSIPKTPTGLRYCMNSGAMKFIPKATGSGH